MTLRRETEYEEGWSVRSEKEMYEGRGNEYEKRWSVRNGKRKV